jgi:hypothetical protein
VPHLNLSQPKSWRGIDMGNPTHLPKKASHAEISETISALPRVMTPRKLTAPKTLLHNQLRTKARVVTDPVCIGRGVAVAQW